MSKKIRIGIKVADLVERLLFSKLELLCVQIKEDERKERQEQERVKREQKRAADKARREAAAAEAALNRYRTVTLPSNTSRKGTVSRDRFRQKMDCI
jgi:hypothetical protein